MSNISKNRNYTGAKIKLPVGSSMCLGDLGILEKVLIQHDGEIKRKGEDGIVINAPFESKDDYVSFLNLLSLEFLTHSNLGISHYLDLHNILDPSFVGRRSLILESYSNYCRFGDVFYENILEKFADEGLRVIRTFVGYDFVMGFEEIKDANYILDRYKYISGSVEEIPRDLDISKVEFLNV